MSIKRCFVGLAAGCLLLGMAGLASAAPVYWTEWTGTTAGAPVGVYGTITGPGIGTVDVTYSGLYAGVQLDDTGANYWAPESTYADGTIVDNGPPLKGIIQLNGGGSTVHTITFSDSVVNPVMAIVSLGRLGAPVTYDFDAPFDIITNGPGAFGNGPLTELAGDVLEGREGHGTIQFQGTFNSISWTIPSAEYWHGFTVGIAGIDDGPCPNPIPAPGALLLVGLGTGLIGYRRRRGSL